MFLKLITLVVSLSFANEGTADRAATVITPTKLATQSISFSDDMDWKNMELALTRQMESFNQKPSLSQKFQYGKDVYTLGEIKASIELFQKVVRANIVCLRNSGSAKSCNATLTDSINAQFNIYEPVPASTEPGYGTNMPTFFTAYYSPDLEGSLVKTPIYKNPIYALPAAESLRTLTREKIDFENGLNNRGLELVWVKEDLFDLYLLQVQGGGRVRVQGANGREVHYYLSYAGSNGHPMRFISTYMMNQGWLTPEDRGIEAQKAAWHAHLDQTREIFSYNTSYVYFKFTQDEPLGIEGIPLTEGRSLATDIRIYKNAGVLNFIQSFKPVKGADGKPEIKAFSRFFVSQDTGGAIRGNARADLYFGFGEEAAYVAYNTKVQGNQYFLIKKKKKSQKN